MLFYFIFLFALIYQVPNFGLPLSSNKHLSPFSLIIPHFLCLHSSLLPYHCFAVIPPPPSPTEILSIVCMSFY